MTRLPCSHVAPDSCPDCSGSARDGREVGAQNRARLRELERLMRTSPSHRAAWVASFHPDLQAVMAADADRRYGPLPLNQPTGVVA